MEVGVIFETFWMGREQGWVKSERSSYAEKGREKGKMGSRIREASVDQWNLATLAFCGVQHVFLGVGT